jgi:hypothetical protein
MTVPAKKPDDAATIENVLVRGDLKDLNEAQRTEYYLNVCKSLGLNPATRPFDYLLLNGKLQLYARRDAADQLRKLNSISIEVVSREIDGDLLTVHVRAKDKTGRTDEDFGVVPFKGGASEIAANSIMKAITKAKRRVTLSISGLGFLDETETDFAKGEQADDAGDTLPNKAVIGATAALHGPRISKQQLEELTKEADELAIDKRKLVEFLADAWPNQSITSMADIPAAYFDNVKARFKRRRDEIENTDAKASVQ